MSESRKKKGRARRDKEDDSSPRFNITHDPLPLSPEYTQEVQDLMESILEIGRRGEFQEMENASREALEAHPEIPHFYSYRANALMALARDQDALEEHCRVAEKFPGYVFGKIHYGNYLLNTGRLEEIPQVFSNHFDLARLFPEREGFHVSEALAYCRLAARYFLLVKEADRVREYFSIIEQLAPEDPLLAEIRPFLDMHQALENIKADMN